MIQIFVLLGISSAFGFSGVPVPYLRKATTQTQRHILCLAGPGDNEPGTAEEIIGKIEERFVDLEKSIAMAVQEERFEDAADARDSLFRMQMEEISMVIGANNNFYRAFSDKDMDSMSSVWLDSESVSCVHPGQTPLIGHNKVMHTWKGMLASTDSRFKSNTISPTEVFVSVKGESAWVSCTEEVSMPLPGMTPRKLLATNVFRKSNNRWYLVHHHASACSLTPPQQEGGGQLLQSMQSGGGSIQGLGIVNLINQNLQNLRADSVKLYSSSSKDNFDKVAAVLNALGDRGKGKITLRKGGKMKEAEDGDGDEPDMDSTEKRPTTEGEEPNLNNRERIVLKFIDEDGAAYPLGWSRDTYSQRIIEISAGGQAAQNGVQPGWILTKIGDIPVRTDLEYKIAINATKADGKSEASFEFDTNERTHERTISSTRSSSSSSPARTSAPAASLTSSALRGIGEDEELRVAAKMRPEEDVVKEVEGPPKEEDGSRRVLRTLRRLAHEGRISKETKTVLVTDLITKSIDGLQSVVQVAHDMLTEDSEDAEDFVEQCHVLAARLAKE